MIDFFKPSKTPHFARNGVWFSRPTLPSGMVITPAIKDANTVIPARAFARVNCSGNPEQDWMPPDRVRGRLIKSGMTTIDMFTCRSNNGTEHEILSIIPM